MEYHNLGNSGLEVSRVGLGAMNFGTTMDEKTSRAMVDRFYDAGGNYLDTANFYGGGLRGSNAGTAGISEQTLGKVIKGRRDRFVVGTKGGWLMEDEMRPNAAGLSRTYLSTQIEASLRRLDTDYIDLYQCHVQDMYTPIEETMRVLDDFVRSGKVRYVGVSNWGGWQVVKANMHARRFNLAPIVSNQVWYNLADRTAEFSIIPACRDQDVSIMSWGAYAQGFLTGRYKRGDQGPPPGTDFTLMKPGESSSWELLAVDRVWNILDVMGNIAEREGTSIPNVAMAWLLQRGTCDVVLMGTSALERFDSNMKAVDLRLSDEDMHRLEEASDLPAPYPNNMWNVFSYRESEFYGGLR